MISLAVHLSATSQDVADTALALQVVDAMRLLDRELDRLADALAVLARAHAARLRSGAHRRRRPTVIHA